MHAANNRTAGITFDGRVVTITRHRSAFGVDAGTRTIPIAQISAIQWKAAGRWSGAGHLRLLIAGSPERRYRQGQVVKTDILKDPNAIPFGHGQQVEFEQVKNAIEQALTQGPTAVGTNVSQEIGRLADLHQQGALTDEEFTAAKARLLGS